MSFLNPVNEPVLRFSSTDADAPQINYNARVAGDVKAVLKACLVTGYGAVASAGWSIANEVNHVAEFVSPSAAMSDYRLGIDDTSASSTTWYYQYQDVRVNPAYNAPSKNFQYVTNSHADNGWQLIVSARGIVFLELLQSSYVNRLVARFTYFGHVKSGITDTGSQNMMFFNIGQSATITEHESIYGSSHTHFRLGKYTAARVANAPMASSSGADIIFGASVIDLASTIYACTPDFSVILAEVSGVLSAISNNEDDVYGVSDKTVGGRPVVKIGCGYTTSSVDYIYSRGRNYLIFTDYWEY